MSEKYYFVYSGYLHTIPSLITVASKSPYRFNSGTNETVGYPSNLIIHCFTNDSPKEIVGVNYPVLRSLEHWENFVFLAHS